MAVENGQDQNCAVDFFTKKEAVFACEDSQRVGFRQDEMYSWVLDVN